MSDQPTQIKEEPVEPTAAAPTSGDELPTAKPPASDETAPPAQPAAQDLAATEKADDKAAGEDLSADKSGAGAATTQVADESEVAMETSTTEEKMDEKVSEAGKESSSLANDQSAVTSDQHSMESTTTSEQQPAAQADLAQPTTTTTKAAELKTEPKIDTSNQEPAPQADQQNAKQQEQPQPPKQQPQPTSTTKEYLDATVVPILHFALSQLAKIRPEDPVKFLANYLLENKDRYPSEFKFSS